MSPRCTARRDATRLRATTGRRAACSTRIGTTTPTPTRGSSMRLAAATNLLKTWLIVAILSAAAGGIGWLLAGTRGLTLFVFCSLLAALAVYAYGDRALLGMLGA